MDWEKELEFYDSLIKVCNGFERKGKKMIYTSSNGYMFSLLNKAGEIGIRLPKDIAKQFMEDYNTGAYYSYGAKMKDYVLVPRTLYDNKDLLVEYLEKSFAYVNNLQPK